MADRTISTSQLGLIASTRGLLGAGIALLLAPRLTTNQRKSVGLTLTLIGIVSTIPLAMSVFGTRSRAIDGQTSEDQANARASRPKRVAGPRPSRSSNPTRRTRTRKPTLEDGK